MSLARKAIRGVFVNWLGTFIQFASAFLITPIVINNLGSESYGVWQLIMDVVGYGSLVDLGLGSSTVKHLSEFEAKKDMQSYVNCVAAARKANRGQALCVLGALLLVVLGFPYFVKLEEVSAATVRWATLLNGLRVAVTLVGHTSRCILRSKQRFDLANGIDASFALISSLGMLAMASVGAGLIALGFVNLVLGICVQLVAFTFATRESEVPPGIVACDDPALTRRMFNYGAYTILAKVAGRVSNFSGNIVAGVVLGPLSVAYYAPAATLCAKIQQVGISMVQFLLPAAASAKARGDTAGLQRVAIVSIRILMCLSLFASMTLIVFGRNFIEIWLNRPEFTANTYPVLVLLALSLLIRLPSFAITPILAGTDMVQLIANRAILEAIITVVLEIGLGAYYGLPGVATGVLLSQIVIVGLLQPRYLARAIEMPVQEVVPQIVIRPLLTSIPALASAVALARYFPVGLIATLVAPWIAAIGIREGLAQRLAAVLELGFQISIVAGVLFGVAFFICLDRSARRSFLPKRGNSKVNSKPLNGEAAVTDENPPTTTAPSNAGV